jgi:hypothetical protein
LDVQDRQVAPPNLPPLKYYQPLGKLLEQGVATKKPVHIPERLAQKRNAVGA